MPSKITVLIVVADITPEQDESHGDVTFSRKTCPGVDDVTFSKDMDVDGAPDPQLSATFQLKDKGTMKMIC